MVTAGISSQGTVQQGDNIAPRLILEKNIIIQERKHCIGSSRALPFMTTKVRDIENIGVKIHFQKIHVWLRCAFEDRNTAGQIFVSLS